MRFFLNDDMEFAARLILGSCVYQAAEPGEALSTMRRVAPDDPESWYQEWYRIACQVRDEAERAESAGHPYSASLSFLRAATYFSAALRFIDATADPGRMPATWRKHRACWDAFVRLRGFSRVRIPYERTTLPGFFFPAARPAGGRRPLVILNNGSDGPTSAMWVMGAAGAIARGYHALAFDGPGQQSALYDENLYFRPDWERVIGPVVDYVLSRPDVDADRIALVGVNQAGYWVPRALAFERRIAAGTVDPGVYDVSTLWLRGLPEPVRDLLDHDKQHDFDEAIRMMSAVDQRRAASLASRMRPYGMNSPYDLFRAVRSYNLDGVADRIDCPMLVLDPEGEQFWPGQSQRLYDALRCPKRLHRFTADQGADGHCEPLAPALRDEVLFDWLDTTLAVRP